MELSYSYIIEKQQKSYQLIMAHIYIFINNLIRHVMALFSLKVICYSHHYFQIENNGIWKVESTSRLLCPPLFPSHIQDL